MKKFWLLFLILIFPSWVSAITFKNPITSDTFAKLIENLINFVFTISLYLAVLLLVLAGVFMVTAAGETAQFERGKKILIYTLVGLIIVMMSKGIMVVIKEYILK